MGVSSAGTDIAATGDTSGGGKSVAVVVGDATVAVTVPPDPPFGADMPTTGSWPDTREFIPLAESTHCTSAPTIFASASGSSPDPNT